MVGAWEVVGQGVMGYRAGLMGGGSGVVKVWWGSRGGGGMG